MQTRNAIGTRIRELRRERGLALADVAEAAGLSASHLSRIERGHAAPSFTVATRIAAVLGVRPGELATMQREQSATDAVTQSPDRLPRVWDWSSIARPNSALDW